MAVHGPGCHRPSAARGQTADDLVVLETLVDVTTKACHDLEEESGANPYKEIST